MTRRAPSADPRYIGPQVVVRIPEDLLARVDAAAAREGTTRAEHIRVTLAETHPARRNTIRKERTP